jgi:hypothetical protein
MVGFDGAAIAADMPVKAPQYAPPPAAFSWTGFYIGILAESSVTPAST